MNVTEAAYKLVSGRYALASESKLGRSDLMAVVEKAFGGSKGAAAALGVTMRTWQRWRSGEIKNMRRSHQLGLRQAVRRVRLSPKREARLRAAGAAHYAPSFVVTGDFLVSNEVRKDKRASIGMYLSEDEDRIGPIVDAFLRADDEAMTVAFQVASNDYQTGEWINITKVEF